MTGDHGQWRLQLVADREQEGFLGCAGAVEVGRHLIERLGERDGLVGARRGDGRRVVAGGEVAGGDGDAPHRACDRSGQQEREDGGEAGADQAGDEQADPGMAASRRPRVARSAAG